MLQRLSQTVLAFVGYLWLMGYRCTLGGGAMRLRDILGLGLGLLGLGLPGFRAVGLEARLAM